MIHRARRHERIVSDPQVMTGKPVIKGTRIAVELILRKLGAGMTCKDIIADHPHVTTDDIRAAQAFAADYLADEAVTWPSREAARRGSDGGRARSS